MKVAFSQIDARLGDISGACERIREQVEIAHRSGADLVCFPAPLMTGVDPGTLMENANFEHELLTAFHELSASFASLGTQCVIPAFTLFRGGTLLEFYLLKEGRVMPLRTMMALGRDEGPANPWAPPVFDVSGVRVALTFDAYRDVEAIPSGCDALLFFQVNGYTAGSRYELGAAGLADDVFRDLAIGSGVWIGGIVPIGSFDSVVYLGGSFLLDDEGRLVARCPSFEEGMLVHDIQPGISHEVVPDSQLPSWDSDTCLWEALRLYLRDSVFSTGVYRAIVHLDGSFSSYLLASLAVDALGSRSVVALIIAHEGISTPEGAALDHERLSRVRSFAWRLGVQLVERGVDGGEASFDRGIAGAGSLLLDDGIEGLCLADTARQLDAIPLSPLCKTDAALALGTVPDGGRLAPFGDTYLTGLERLARLRVREGSFPREFAGKQAVEAQLAARVSRLVEAGYSDGGYRARVAALLRSLDACAIDAVLEGHVDRSLPFEQLEGSGAPADVVALLLLLVRRGEGCRRALPSAPILSARSFVERAWPEQLAWSDLGRHGADALRSADLAKKELKRLEEEGEDHAARMRREVMRMIGGMLGLSPEQMDAAESGELEVGTDEVQGHMRDAMRRMAEAMGSRGGDAGTDIPGGFPFFSQN